MKQNVSSRKSEKTNSNYSLEIKNEFTGEDGIKRVVGAVKNTPFIARSGPDGYELAIGKDLITHKKYKTVKEIYKDVENINWEIVSTIAAIVAEKVCEDIMRKNNIKIK